MKRPEPIRSAGRVTRIAVLNSHPIQYFAPLYAYLNAAPDLNVTALYLSDFSIRGGKDAGFGRDVRWDLDLLAGYRSVFLGKGAHTREPGGFWSLIAPQVWSELRSGRYDVVWLHGHQYAANLIALMAAKTAGLPVMMRGETHLGLPCGGIKSILRRLLQSCLRPAFGYWLGECGFLSGYGCIRSEDIPHALFRGQRPFFAVCKPDQRSEGGSTQAVQCADGPTICAFRGKVHAAQAA
jgi:hypothetical protein